VPSSKTKAALAAFFLGCSTGTSSRRAQAVTNKTDMIDYKKRAEECRDLATREYIKMEDGVHFLEMAQTWEKLADLYELTQRLKSSGALLKKPAMRAE
jgi:hypothetical protein